MTPSLHGDVGAADRRRWSAALTEFLREGTTPLWRQHVDALHRELVERWLPRRPASRLLKTDLFDEAVGDGLVAALLARAGAVAGLDITDEVVRRAQERSPALATTVADVRRLPFAAGSFDVIVSNSTLDHFATRAEIAVALGEFHRVLSPAGDLLITLDNLQNPVIALRNALPQSLLQRARLVPYPVGCTCGMRGLERMLVAAGFEIRDTATLLHCLRMPAIRAAARAEAAGAEARRRWLRRVRRWERLAAAPTRLYTANFIAVLARRR